MKTVNINKLIKISVFGFLGVLAYNLIPEDSPESKVVELKIQVPEKVEVSSIKSIRIEEFGGYATCSGAFIDNDGDILTAKHCTAISPNITVQTNDNQHYEATIVAESKTHDLAVIHINKRHTPYFKLASSVIRGEKIFILGSPLAITNTLSTGIVAKLDGDTTLVDCSALPGNSGSTVYNTKQELIGVLNAGYVVGMGVTHLNVVQSLSAVRDFLDSLRN